MNIGTRSILFGAHQFILHPIFVTLGWRKAYDEWPNWRELVCIAIHDIGYWGTTTMDGDDGKLHPIKGADVARRLFGWHYEHLVLYHSRFMAKDDGIEPSKLCLADKLGVGLTPSWLWTAQAVLSGEWYEYKRNMEAGHYGSQELNPGSPMKFHKSYKKLCEEWVKTGDTSSGIWNNNACQEGGLSND